MKTRTARVITSIIAGLLILGFLLSMGYGLFTYAADNSKTLSGLKGKLANIQKEKSSLVNEKKQIEVKKAQVAAQAKDIQTQLAQLAEEQAGILDEKRNIDMQIQLTLEQIELSEQIMAELEEQIAQRSVELAAAQEDEARQYELFKTRLRAMYESGDSSTLSMILTCGSLTDIFFRIEAMSDVAQYDRTVMERLSQVREYVASLKAQLEADKADEEQTRLALLQYENELSAQNAQMDVMLVRLDRITAENEQALAEVEAVEEEFEQQLRAMMAQIAAKDSQIGSTQSDIKKTEAAIAAEKAAKANAAAGAKYSGGTMSWPCPGNYTITSPYGMRKHPVTGVYKLHNGIDIGAPKNAKIVAASAGTVSTVSYSSAWGNYVIISHGGGVQTLYAHMTRATVTEGKKVSAGDDIGRVGSTGYSTGNHLHFTVYVNGASVSPTKYLG